MYLILGPTSFVGRHLVGSLIRDGHRVRAFQHRTETPDWEGAEVAKGSLEDVDSIRRACEGVTAMYLIAPPKPSPAFEQLEANALTAAAAAGCRRVIKQSVLGASPTAPVGIMRAHAASEAALRRSGLEFVILRANSFIQDLGLLLPTILASRALRVPCGDSRVSFVDAADIADVAQWVLLHPVYDGRTFELTGPQPMTFEELAQALSACAGVEIAFESISDADMRRGMLAGGFSEWMADEIIAHFAYWRSGGSSVVTDSVAAIAGHHPRDPNVWIAQAVDQALVRP
jgi:uncharacterized protein YbjT (DUF2867 family)